MAVEPQEMNWGAAIGWASGVAALTISGIGGLAALSQGAYVFVAGFTACFVLTAYALWGGSREDAEA